MAASAFNFKIDKGLSGSWTMRWIVASGTTSSILQGMPTFCKTAEANIAGVVVAGVDGDGIATGERFAGLSKSVSTETAAANGFVETWAPVAGLLYRGNCLSTTAMNTQAKIDALIGKKVFFDRTADTAAGTYTVDTAATAALANAVVIVGGNPLTNECLFIYTNRATVFDTATTI